MVAEIHPGGYLWGQGSRSELRAASGDDAWVVDLAEVFKSRTQVAVDWTHDPAGWIQGKGSFLWSKQRSICSALVANDKVAVRAGHGVGKSWLAAKAACWWIDSHPPGTAFVVSTAPTYPQVRAILWREMNRTHREFALDGKMNQTEWSVGGELVAIGRKPADHDEHGLQGIHAEYLLMILDEAGGIPKQLWDGAETVATGDGCKILAIGNPDDPSSHFRKVCELPGGAIGVGKSDLGWEVLQIKAWDSPNVTGEEVPDVLRRSLTGSKWIEDKRRSWGEGSPLWQAKIEAEFPSDAKDQVVSWGALLACQRADFELVVEDDGERILGVDVGGGGDDSAICGRIGGSVVEVWKGHTPDAADVVELCLRAIGVIRPRVINVDSNGIGWGVVTLLREKFPAIVVNGVNVSRRAADPERFAALRDELWWQARERSLARGWKLAALEEEDLQEFAGPKWSVISGGRTKVEAKDETRKRLGRSPNVADACLLAWADSDVDWGEGGGSALDYLDELRAPALVPGVPAGWQSPFGDGSAWDGSGMLDL